METVFSGFGGVGVKVGGRGDGVIVSVGVGVRVGAEAAVGDKVDVGGGVKVAGIGVGWAG